MSKEEIEKQLKLSKRQSKDERYEYINSHFNQTNYAMELEKYTLKILRKYTQLQNNWNELKKYIGEQLQYYSLCEDDYKEFNILDSVESEMQELEQVK